MLSYKSQSTQNELMNSCIDGIDNLFQTIYNIESHDDFTFMVDDLEIKCNRLFASFISPTITKNFQTDRTINSFTFHVEDFIKIIKSFNNVILHAPLGSNSMLDQQYAFSNEIKSKIQEKLIEIIQKTTQLKLGYYVSTQNPEETSINEYLILLKIFKNLGNDNFVQKLNDNFNHYLTKHDELPIDNRFKII